MNYDLRMRKGDLCYGEGRNMLIFGGKRNGKEEIMDRIMEMKSLKIDILEKLMAIDDPKMLQKIKSYIKKASKQETINETTRKAIEEMEKGEMIHFDSFEDYIKMSALS